MYPIRSPELWKELSTKINPNDDAVDERSDSPPVSADKRADILKSAKDVLENVFDVPTFESPFPEPPKKKTNNPFLEGIDGANSVLSPEYLEHKRINMLDRDDLPYSSNVLNDYTDVMYHVALTMIPEAQAKEVRNGSLIDTNGTIFDDNDNVVLTLSGIAIASTGDILREDLPDVTMMDEMNYYNITEVEFENIMAPTTNNPMISNMISVGMTIVEPVGLRLHDDLRHAANKLGYKQINIGRIVYKLDIWFSGYDSFTGNWVSEIPLSSEGSVRYSAFLVITGLDTQMTAAGTEYQVSMAPVGHFAYRPEEMIIEAEKIWSGEDNTFGSFLDHLQSVLKDVRSKRTNEQIKRTFEFEAPPELLESTFYDSDLANQKHYLGNFKAGGTIIPIGKDNDIITLLQGALADLQGVWDSFLRDDDPTFATPRTLYTIRFETKYGAKNPATNDYDEITYKYIIEPFDTFKKGTPEQKTVGDYVSKTSQITRLRSLIQRGMLVRSYDYINSSTNTEVIDFNINLKMFYYETLHTETDTTTSVGHGTSEPVDDNKNLRTERDEEGKARNEPSDFSFDQHVTDQILFELLGEEIEESNKNVAVAPEAPLEKLGASQGERSPSQQFGNLNSSGHKRRDKYTQYFDSHFKYDLLSLNDMKIKGDPVWFFSSYGSIDLITKNLENGNAILSTAPTRNSAKVIYLRIIPSWQGDYMNPNRISVGTYPNIIGGFYELVKVKSILSGGTFTQLLDGYKLTHLNYVEQYFKRSERK